jgi:hypothetical protein
VENEARIRRQIQGALDPVVRPAPWLAESIRESIGGLSKRRSWPLVNSETLRWSIARTAVAILLVIAVVAALLVGSRALSHLRDVPAQPLDPAVRQYRAVVDRNFPALQHLIETGVSKTCNNSRAAVCREQVMQTKDAAIKFQADLADLLVPSQLQSSYSDLKKGLADVVVALDAMLSDLDRNNFDGYASDYEHLFFTKLYEVYPPVTAIDCWPRAAVDANDPSGAFRLKCGIAPSAGR